MQVRYCALAIGTLFLILGIAGFIPAFVSIPDAAVNAPIDGINGLSTGYGYLFGMFPTNYLHNAVHIVVGLLGLAAFTSFGGSVVYLQGFAIAYVLIAIMGILPITNTTFGLMPIFGHNVWFNMLTAIIAGYYGFMKAADEVNMATPSNI